MLRYAPVMRRPSSSDTAAKRLARVLAGESASDPLSAELAVWLASSRRFGAFAEAHRDKIRKKLRGATSPEARGDVRAELLVAHLLLADRRIELAFEAYGSGKPGPDFTVTIRGGRSFNLEVTRPRRWSDSPGAAGTILAKLRQLPPGVPNMLVVAIGGDTAAGFDVGTAVDVLRARAGAKDEAFFTRRRFGGSREFNLRYRRLGALLVWCEAAEGDVRATSWTNASARAPVPERAIRTCLSCLRGG